MKTRSLIAVLSALALPLGATGVASAAETVNGAGATFAAPFWQQLGADFKAKTGNIINYQSVGSGAGIAQFTARTVDFGGSDAPMNRDEQGKAQSNGVDVLHFPATLGAITISYNVPGVKTGLKLTGKTIAQIYLGQITTWNNPAIARLNKGVTLPNTPITVVRRSDSSGTTYNFTRFLNETSTAWKNGPGWAKDVKWPVGTGGRGNEGVAAAVKQTTGAIGYVELAFAVQNQFTWAAVRNKAGAYELPTRVATSAAGVGIKVPPTLKVNITNSPNKQAYPIAAATFAMVYKDVCKAGVSPAKAKVLSDFLKFAVGNEGQTSAKKLLYSPLPAGLQKKSLAGINSLTCNGSPIR